MIKPLALGAALALCAGSAFAAAPQPTKPVPLSIFSGRWFEVARLPNSNQKDCHGATSVFTGGGDGKFAVTQTCHKGSAEGPAKTVKAAFTVVPGSNNAKINMTFFGLVHQQYWFLDRAANNAWAIMATPGGNYVWLLSRVPSLSPADRAAALARIQALGYPVDRLEFPQQGG